MNCKKDFNIGEERLTNLTFFLWCNEIRAHVQKLNNTIKVAWVGIMFATMQNKHWSSEKKELNWKRANNSISCFQAVKNYPLISFIKSCTDCLQLGLLLKILTLQGSGLFSTKSKGRVIKGSLELDVDNILQSDAVRCWIFSRQFGWRVLSSFLKA